MKIKLNQRLISTFRDPQMTLMVLVAGITILPLGLQSRDNKTEQTLVLAEEIGTQVVAIYRDASRMEPENERSPASIAKGGLRGLKEEFRSTGTTGKDPWGTPFQYRLISEDDSGNVRILVWSAGPNKKIESFELLDEGKEIKYQPVYSGDDLGVLLSMSQK